MIMDVILISHFVELRSFAIILLTCTLKQVLYSSFDDMLMYKFVSDPYRHNDLVNMLGFG
jgi:hypothetical protein